MTGTNSQPDPDDVEEVPVEDLLRAEGYNDEDLAVLYRAGAIQPGQTAQVRR